MWSQLRSTGKCWQPFRSNHVFGIVGDWAVFGGNLLSFRAERNTVGRTQPVQFGWSLSFNMRVPHSSRRSQLLQCSCGVQEEKKNKTKQSVHVRGFDWCYEHPLKYKRNIKKLLVCHLCGWRSYRTCFWRCKDQKKKKKKEKRKEKMKNWATFVPFFTTELGRCRSEGTLFRKP